MAPSSTQRAVGGHPAASPRCAQRSGLCSADLSPQDYPCHHPFRSPYAENVRTPTTLPYWRVCLINGAVFIAGTRALALSPATVSAVLRSEAIVLGVGLTTILMTNACILRNVLRPLGRLSQMMSTMVFSIGARLPATGNAVVAERSRTFGLQSARHERSATPAQEAERQRIGRELHDEVGQMLTCYSAQSGPAIAHRHT